MQSDRVQILRYLYTRIRSLQFLGPILAPHVKVTTLPHIPRGKVFCFRGEFARIPSKVEALKSGRYVFANNLFGLKNMDTYSDFSQDEL